MGDIAIRVENLSKRYHIGSNPGGYKTLREAVTDIFRKPFTRVEQRERETLWALRNVSFEINQGEAVGIIGRNGAGKSTLLKILSRITKPTEGKVRLQGRVGSLLEVGTGFHPELTGRDNIYLNGAILGMKRADIARKFDEIVEFAEISRFLDTPVKFYSSGMYTRLAFAVAAHLEPEILVVDEVLAVGDSAFQKKCLGKMENVAYEGRTVLFVSHNMAAIQNLCKRGILLSHGKLIVKGDIEQVINTYLDEVKIDAAVRDISEVKPRFGSGGARLLKCALLSSDGKPVTEIRSDSNAQIMVTMSCPSVTPESYLSIEIYRFDNVPIFSFVSLRGGMVLIPGLKPQSFIIEIPRLPLMPGNYFIKLGISNSSNQLYDFVDPALSLYVIPGKNSHPIFSEARRGILDIDGKWTRAE